MSDVMSDVADVVSDAAGPAPCGAYEGGLTRIDSDPTCCGSEELGLVKPAADLPAGLVRLKHH